MAGPLSLVTVPIFSISLSTAAALFRSAAVIMLLLINAFQAFDEFYNMLGSIGSFPPYGRPPLVHLYLIALGGGQQDLGIGGAGTMILTALIVVFGVTQNWVLNRGERKAR